MNFRKLARIRDEIVTFVCVFILVLWAFSKVADSQEYYLEGRGGFSEWGDTSNSDQVEADSDRGYAFALEGGYRHPLGSYGPLNFGLGAGFELGYRTNDTHGRNDEDRNRSQNGDGHVFTGLFKLSPEVAYGPVSLYGGGGVGRGCAVFFGDLDCALAYGAQVGIRWAFTERWYAVVEASQLWLEDTSHDGFGAEFDSQTVQLGLGYRW